MTKKDYEKFAAMMRTHICVNVEPADQWEAGYDSAMREVANSLASVFQRDNPRFDRERFLKACGIE